MLPVRKDFTVPSRTTAFIWEGAFLDGAQPLDFTGYGARMQVRLYGEASTPLIDLALADTGQGLKFYKATSAGVLDGLRILIGAGGLAAMWSPGGEPSAAQRFSYDLLLDPPSSLEEVWMHGTITLFSGVTR